MMKSMTGFGSATLEANGLIARAEVKSLNSKALDLNVRLPKSLLDKEFELRNLVAKYLERGKVLLNIELEYESKSASASSLNSELMHFHFNTVWNEAKALPVEVDASSVLQSILRIPEVMAISNGSANKEAEWQLAQKAAEQALKACDEFRLTEGNVLENKVSEYISTIEALLKSVSEMDPERMAGVRQRIEEKLSVIKSDAAFDPNRFEQEMIFYSEKLDITEEKTRLSNHLEHFLEVLHKEQNAGRKLGFISQEIGREINTIGSKANHAPTQKLVVLMKDELEKIKEQGLNFL